MVAARPRRPFRHRGTGVNRKSRPQHGQVGVFLRQSWPFRRRLQDRHGADVITGDRLSSSRVGPPISGSAGARSRSGDRANSKAGSVPPAVSIIEGAAMAKAWKFPERMSRLWYFVLVLIFVPLLLAVTYQFVDGVRSKSASANGGGVFAFAGPILIGLKMRLRDAGTPSWISILLLVVGGLLVVAMQMLPMMRLDWIVAHGLSRTTWQLMTPECVGAFGVLTAMVLGAGVLPPSQPVAPEAAAPVAPDSGRGPVLMDPALLPLQASPGPLSSVPPPAGSEALRLSWSQPPGMVALSFKNFLLKIVTLGIYQFWGKTEVRRRIWSASASTASRCSTPAPARRCSSAFWSCWPY